VTRGITVTRAITPN